MKNMIKPILVLTLICLVVSVLLAAVNSMTEPIIDEREAQLASDACARLIPGGTGFEQIDIPDGLPSTIKAIYRESSGQGYVYKMVTTGYKSGFQIMCGISADGKITATEVIANNETPGYGSRTAEKSYTDLYIGYTSELGGEELLLSGATISSRAFKSAIADAFTAHQALTR